MEEPTSRVPKFYPYYDDPRIQERTSRVPEFAYYYGDSIWDEELTGWIKSLLLFFDGIALVLPTYEADRLMESGSVLAQPLAELGLLRNYEPDLLIGAPIPASSRYYTRSGALAQFLRRFEEGGLPYEDFIPANARLITAINQKCGGDLEANLRALGGRNTSDLLSAVITEVAIEPVIDDENAAAFAATLIGSLDERRGGIVTGDLVQIGLDLSAVPLDEVLGFRSEYGSEYRMYARDIRKFVLDLSLIDEANQQSALMDRRAELRDREEQLRKIGRRAFARQAMAFGFGLTGAAWTLAHGDPWGAVFAAAAASAGLTRQDPEPIGASYTYILRAKAELAR
jgi:hypothetical protein